MAPYAYDHNGQRTSKTVGSTVHTYYYASGKLLRETYGSTTLDFYYDASGTPFALKYGGTVYYYITNLQGDVIRIVSQNGASVADYEYSPFGEVISATGTLAAINPLRYRGYYYDTESELYYLNSRYYDPKVGRFINADAFVSTGQGYTGNNMFAYCNNDPVNYGDSSGSSRVFLLEKAADAAGGGGCGIAIGIATSTIVGSMVSNAKKQIKEISASISAAQKTVDEKGPYVVYVLLDKKEVVQYVGRTQNAAAREDAHKSNPFRRHLTFEKVATNLNYAQARGLEQTLMLYYHTINTRSKMHNQINGISIRNTQRDIYIEAAQNISGYIWNQISNEVLCWAGT